MKNQSPSVNGIIAKDVYLVKQDSIVEYAQQVYVKTEEKLRISEEHFHLLVEGIKDYAIFMLDPNGTIITWNKGAKHLIGYSNKDIIGKNFSVLFTPEDKQTGRPETELQTAIQKGYVEDTGWVLKKDGQRIWVSGTTTALANGKIHCLAKIIHDMSEIKERDVRKDTFISMASHELKTPITSLKLYMQLLDKELQQQNVSAPLLAKMDRQLDKLTHLIADLLDLPRIQQGELTFEKELFPINNLIQEVVENIQGITETHTITVEKQTKKQIFADRDRIGQILINVLLNAVKYSPQSKKIIVSSVADKKYVTVSVRDFGIGITKENQDKVFDRFYRVEGLSEKTYPGFGIGLYIASEIVRKHSGKIWVESTKDQGSTFSFSLPLAKTTFLKSVESK